MRPCRPARLRCIAVMASEAIKGELQHDFARARRPGSFALDILKPFEKAANIEQQAGELRTDCIKGAMYALTSRNHCLGRLAGSFAATPV